MSAAGGITSVNFLYEVHLDVYITSSVQPKNSKHIFSKQSNCSRVHYFYCTYSTAEWRKMPLLAGAD